MPRISVGLPVYNGGELLRQALQSLVDQTYRDYEIVISDNASTDQTPKICEEFAERYPVVRYHRFEENIGAAGNFNRTYELGSGEYYKWAAHDDRCAPTYLERCLEVMESDPAASLVQSRVTFINADNSPCIVDVGRGLVIDSNGRHWGFDPVRPAGYEAEHPVERFATVLRHNTWCVEIFGLMRRKLLDRSQLHLPFYGSDRVLLAEMALAGKFREVPEALFQRRCHSSQSCYLPAKQKLIWIDARARKGLLRQQRQALVGFVRAVQQSDLPNTQKALGHLEIAKMVLSLDKLRKLFLPGPYNYLGMNWRAR